ncbi:hypothetical protein [Alistipes senegalensis]|uniref:hypothetical protein n=1 Tax=Alistipes senegalensis TaxID=1288121 RepID=UPI00242F5253|nr:hypothetical protein [Alistipes senegalensis]MCI7307982.1 hypothetical protein [Alistipes senegalensis]MDD7040029.1 hypothetical protein [Alistipes senegalensis]
MKKVLKSFGDSEKRLTFAPASMRSDKQKGSENFLKNFSKSFGGSKNNTYLCTTFR